LRGLVGSDADSVRHGLGSSEGPARSAVGLVSDLDDGRAVGPGGVGGERDGDVGVDFSDGGHPELGRGLLGGGQLQGSVELGNGLEVHLSPSGVVGGLPGQVGLVDQLGDLSEVLVELLHTGGLLVLDLLRLHHVEGRGDQSDCKQSE